MCFVGAVSAQRSMTEILFFFAFLHETTAAPLPYTLLITYNTTPVDEIWFALAVSNRSNAFWKFWKTRGGAPFPFHLSPVVDPKCH